MNRKRKNGEQLATPKQFVVPNDDARGAVNSFTWVTFVCVSMFWGLPLLVKKGPDLVPGATFVVNSVLTAMIVISAIGWVLYPKMVKTVTLPKRERREPAKASGDSQTELGDNRDMQITNSSCQQDMDRNSEDDERRKQEYADWQREQNEREWREQRDWEAAARESSRTTERIPDASDGQYR